MKCVEFWRQMNRVLNSHEFHVSVLVLVIIDCFVLTAELIIDHLNDALKDLKKKTDNNTANLTSHDIVHEGSGFGPWAPYFYVLEDVFKYTSLVILSIFLFEIALKLVFTPQNYCKILEVFDALVIIVSFSLNLYLLNKKHHIHSITGLITMLRLWRFTELINGVVLTIETKHDHKIKELKEKIRNLEAENEMLKQVSNLSDIDNSTEYDNFKLERKNTEVDEDLTSFG